MALTDIRFEHAALIYLDFQVDVCAEGGKMVSQEAEVLSAFKQARDSAAALLNAGRAGKNAPQVIHVMHAYEEGYPEFNQGQRGGRLSPMESYVKNNGAFIRGGSGTQIVAELQPEEGETLLTKQTLSPFAGTDLHARLSEQGVNTVILAGVVTHYAILATAFSAYDLGYSVVVKDACMSGVQATHNTALGILGPIAELVDSADLMTCLA